MTTFLVIWGIERVLIAFVGLASITFGYFLFLKGVVVDQAAEIERQSWKVKLQKVGPGVFFAGFGAAIIAIMATKQVTVEEFPSVTAHLAATSSGNEESPVGQIAARYSYGGNTIPDTALQLSQAINTIEQAVDLPNDPQVGMAKEALINFRNAEVARRFGIDKVRIYRGTDPAPLAQKQQIRDELLPWPETRLGD